NVAYYQDREKEAAFELVITDSPGTDGSNFILRGELMREGEKYFLNPPDSRVKRDASSPETPEDASYNLVSQPTSPVALHDVILVDPEEKVKVETKEPNIPGVEPLANVTTPLRRASRQSTQTIFIDVVAVVDHSAYSRFQASSSNKAATLQAVREYYAFIFNGVDMRFQGITNSKYSIRARLVKLLIAETAQACQFTEKYRVSNSPRDRIDANDALYALSEFVVGPGRDIILSHDHVILFTTYDLTSKSSTGSVSESTTGLAYTNTMCRTDGKSASIVEDVGGFQCIETATHEMGHSLSSPHDGEGNVCDSNDRYIMSTGGLPATETNKYNPWYFSKCSIDYITKFIDEKLATSAGKTCLTQQMAIGSGVVDIGDRLPGQEFSADDQCRMIYGSQSRLCRGEEFATAEEVCVSMFCFDPSTTGTCYKHKAASGTTCGTGKMCLNGKCVADPRAPNVDGNCVFGDQPGVAFEDKTCPVFIENFSGYCYQEVVRNRCCGSCQKKYSKISGCEYGDTVRGCKDTTCTRASSNTLKQCCGTCKYGSPKASTQTRTAASQTKPPTYPAVTQARTTPVPVTTNPGANTTCIDNPNTRIGSHNCSLVKQLSYLCCIQQLRDACCQSCKSNKICRF
ncbi:unnamed protein product, partial [Candidula unifasciata]